MVEGIKTVSTYTDFQYGGVAEWGVLPGRASRPGCSAQGWLPPSRLPPHPPRVVEGGQAEKLVRRRRRVRERGIVEWEREREGGGVRAGWSVRDSW